MEPITTTPIRILLVDDLPLFRKGLSSLCDLRSDYCVVGEAADGLEAQAKARALAPDVILMDINMPHCDGVEATRQIKAQMPHTKIIMLTVSDDNKDLFDAIRAGADGYLLKNLEPDQLFVMVENVRRGEPAITGKLATRILEEFRDLSRDAASREEPAEEGVEALTGREHDVLKLVATGDSNKEIADVLCISENTVKLHLRNILEKLHLRNRVQATAYALRHGLTGDVRGEQEGQ